MESSRKQLGDVLRFLNEHRNGIGIHLRKLYKTERCLRNEIDSMFEETTKTKSKRRAKKLNNDLIQIVQHRNDHQSRMDSSSFAAKTISNLLNDENAQSNLDSNLLLGQQTPTIEEYLSIRQSIDQIRKELVECVEQREFANLALS